MSKTLCKLGDKKIKKLDDSIYEPIFKCKKCGREASSKLYLCNGKKIRKK